MNDIMQPPDTYPRELCITQLYTTPENVAIANALQLEVAIPFPL